MAIAVTTAKGSVTGRLRITSVRPEFDLIYPH